MLALIDIGAEFWKNYFGSKSAVTAYELTLDRIDWYRHVDCRAVVCCDSPISKRREWYAEYKSNRPPKPADAIESLIAVQQRAASWGIPVVQCEGYEADDLIATLASQAWPEETHIVGSEKDFFCLISDTVKLVGKHGLIGANECFERFGVLPEKMPDWLALVGDAADAIPGCPHCGPGRATTLLERFEMLDGILSASDEEIRELPGIGKKTLESLRAWDPAMARKLVQLLTDAPLVLDTLWGAAA